MISYMNLPMLLISPAISNMLMQTCIATYNNCIFEKHYIGLICRFKVVILKFEIYIVNAMSIYQMIRLRKLCLLKCWSLLL